MMRLLLLLPFLFLPFFVYTQDLRGAGPEVPQLQLPERDNGRLRAQELARRKNGRAPQFALPLEVDLDTKKNGIWIRENGLAIWRQSIHSPGAYSLNLGLSRFELPDGGELYIYTPNKSAVLGPYTKKDQEDHQQLWTPILEGDILVLEIQAPDSLKEEIDLEIGSVNHDYMGTLGVLAGSCNLDVICNGADGWELIDEYRHIIQSVGLYTVNGRSFCTGFLVNNTEEDNRPYFLTAYHCDITPENAPSMVVYWNFENDFCRPPNSNSSGARGNGLKDIVNTGAKLRSNWRDSDFTLVELDDPIPPEANAFLAGWSIESKLAETLTICIHHPQAEEKRFSFTTARPYLGQWETGQASDPEGDHIVVPYWDIGTTELGSSGAPLFNEDGFVIGQLHGGQASCSFQSFDSFGWIGASWNGGNRKDARLKDWLAPGQFQPSFLPGRWYNEGQKSLNFVADDLSVCGPGQYSILLSPVDTTADLLAKVESPSGITASLIESGMGYSLELTIAPELPVNAYPLALQLVQEEDTTVIELELQLQAPASIPEPQIPFIEAQRIDLAWTGKENDEAYHWQLSLDPDFSQIIKEDTSVSSNASIFEPEFNQTYFWRVRALHPCGNSDFSEPVQFTTLPDTRLLVNNFKTSICSNLGTSFELYLGAGFEPPIQLFYTLESGETPPFLIFEPGLDAYKAGDTLRVRLAPEHLPLYESSNQILQFQLQHANGIKKLELPLVVKHPPELSLPLLPENGSSVPGGKPLFSWTFTPSANRYHLQVAKDSAFSDIVFESRILQLTDQVDQPLARGVYYWRMTSQNECGGLQSPVFQFQVVEPGLGTLNGVLAAAVPNPVKEELNIYWSAPLSGLTIELFSPDGRLVRRDQPQGETLSSRFNVRQLAQGVYILRMRHSAGMLTKRIVVY